MSGKRNPDMRYNDSGYTDLTAYEALKKVRQEERRTLIAEMKALANKYGYRIVNTIELKEIEDDFYD